MMSDNTCISNWNELLSNQFFSTEEIRAVDRIAMQQYGMSGLVLMENAGANAAKLILDAMRTDGKVLVLAGSGNNGGDGFVVARHLATFGVPVSVWLLGSPDKLTDDARIQYEILQRAGQSPVIYPSVTRPLCIAPVGEHDREVVEAICDCDVVVDAMLGTGARGNPREPMASAIEVANRHACLRVALDLPTGLDADSGEPSDPTFRADLTCTFVAPKTGFQSASAKEYLGKVVSVPIGVPADLLNRLVRHSLTS